jgi:hypothetical protein
MHTRHHHAPDPGSEMGLRDQTMVAGHAPHFEARCLIRSDKSGELEPQLEGAMPDDGESQKKRPTGRTCGEFFTIGKVLPAEEKLLEACANGEPGVVSISRPDSMTEQNRIRSAFFRFLVLGGDDRVVVHEKGVHVAGAWIDGDIDLEACHATAPVTLDWCYVDGAFILRDAELPCVFFDNSFARGIDGDRFRCPGSLHINNGSIIRGPVLLGGAHIGGDLNCVDARFENREEDALYCGGRKFKAASFLGSKNRTGRFML